MENASLLFDEVYIRDGNQNKILVDKDSLEFRYRIILKSVNDKIFRSRPYYPAICCHIDISNYVKNRTILSITFQLNLIGDHRVDILLEDKQVSASRPITEHQLLFSGDQILIDNLKNTPLAKSYAVSFSQESFNEKDPKHQCVEFPYKGAQSYKQCDDTFIHQLYIDHQLPDPVWVSDFLQLNPAEENYSVPAEYKIGSNLFMGITPSGCLQPCTTVRTQSRWWSSSRGFWNSFRN